MHILGLINFFKKYPVKAVTTGLIALLLIVPTVSLGKVKAKAIRAVAKKVAAQPKQLHPSKCNYDAPLPKHIKDSLDQHAKEVATGPKVMQFNWLPGWYIKAGTERIEGAKKLSRAITDLGYCNFMVPQKYRYQGLDKQKYTIAKAVPISNKTLTLLELKQLIKISQRSGFIDAHGGNVKKTANGKVALIDTEIDYVNEKKYPDKFEFKWLTLDIIKYGDVKLNAEATRYLDNKYTQYCNWRDQKFREKIIQKKQAKNNPVKK